MSLADFLKQLQDQDSSDIIYSEVPKATVKVIPPEKTTVMLIAPEDLKQPTKIKLKFNMKEEPAVSPSVQPEQAVQEPVIPRPTKVVYEQVATVSDPDPEPVIERPKPVQQPVVQEKTESTDEDLFLKSGTESSKRDVWFDYYQRAKSSRKHNGVVDRMRLGRFTITPDNKVWILPDYDVVGKDPDDVIRDKWF